MLRRSFCIYRQIRFLVGRNFRIKIRDLFNDMGYEAQVSKVVELAGRGKKEIDVYVKDSLASHNQVYLVECKNWNHKVPQEVVHAFKFVMESTGASTGFIISKKGFQSCAHAAARFTNIQLLTFEELQHLYGREWLRKKQEKLSVLMDKLRQIYSCHFAQNNHAAAHNNMHFNSGELYIKLCFFNKWIANLMPVIAWQQPESYLGPEPIMLTCNPADPNWQSDEEYIVPTVKEFYDLVYASTANCIKQFEEVRASAVALFDSLPDPEQDEILSRTLKSFQEEMPIRILKGKLESEEYERILRPAFERVQ